MMLGTRNILLGIYDMLAAIGWVAMGVLMIGANYGIFAEYPEEWLGVLPFKGWIPIGVIVITVFGVGNFLAAVTSFIKRRNPWMSIVMGLLVIICIFAQIAMVGWYLASFEIMMVGVLQLLLCAMVVKGLRKEREVLVEPQNLTDEVMGEEEELADKDDVIAEPANENMHEKEEDGSSSDVDEDIAELVEDGGE